MYPKTNIDIIIPKEELNARLEKKGRRLATLTFKIAAFLFPAWAILDYSLAPKEYIAQFLILRLIIAGVLLTTAILIQKNKISLNLAYLIGFSGCLGLVSFFTALVSKDALTAYILGYAAIFLVGYVFLIFNARQNIGFFLYSIIALFGFNLFFKNHTINEIMVNGGYLYLTLGIFGMGAAYLHYVAERNSSLNSLRIRKSNEKLKAQQKALHAKNQEISLQKQAIENKNKEITSSILYAKRIQDAILNIEDIHNQKLPPHYILFLPKDIVSGDFFWEKLIDNTWYVCVADCTGHGVPGGFMSMLGISLLNNIVTGNNISPAEILEELRHKIIEHLHSSSDGMDISLCKINLNDYSAEWSGANNPLWIINPDKKEWHIPKGKYDNNLSGVEIKPDKQPIGKHVISKPFTNHSFKLEKGDMLALFSDGYADQFGGPRGKKFKYRNLKILLSKIYALPVEQQKKFVLDTLLDWQGNFEQIDDICLMGIKL